MKVLRWLWHLLEKIGENAIYTEIDRFYVEKAKEEKKEENK